MLAGELRKERDALAAQMAELQPAVDKYMTSALVRGRAEHLGHEQLELVCRDPFLAGSLTGTGPRFWPSCLRRWFGLDLTLTPLLYQGLDAL